MAAKKPEKLRVGRPRTYTPEALRRAVERYFNSISRTRVVTEPAMTGELDKYGHPVMVPRSVLDDNGEPMTERVWVVRPTKGGLCRELGVSRSTWDRWRDPDAYPEYRETVMWAEDLLLGYLEDELLGREGKNTRGVEFMLAAKYGWRNGPDAGEPAGEGMERFLERLDRDGGGGQEF